MDKTWKELKARGPVATRDLAASLLIDAGSPGVVDGGFTTPDHDVLVSVSGWDDAPDLEIRGGDDGGRAELTAYLPEGGGDKDGPGAHSLGGLAERLGLIGWTFTTSAYTDTDWTVKWRSGIRPVRVSRRGRSVLVKPTWSRARPRPGEAMVRIDPGMAFGTGSHATTRLCVGELIEVFAGAGGRGLSVLDVGCGTGVLAIAAVKLGAGKAVGTDIDPMAVRAARRNVRANGVKALMTERPVEKVSGRFDVVVANILSGELVRLAPELVKKTAPGGLLILSGILVPEAAHVAGVFVDAGMEPGKRRVLGEWAALVLRRPAGGPRR